MSAQALADKKAELRTPKMTDVEMMKEGSETKVLIAIDGCVFDLSSYVDKHPGGKAVLSRNSGKDMSDSFKRIGHSEKAKLQMAAFYVADLQETEEGKAMAEAKKQAVAAAFVPPPAVKRGLPPPI
mmetsp:Transcript_8372/g.19286  ORF Transcript_8372/g.19286 Transcript_8372/m.19286 type:complete len:126 (-) Transcript_8372:26-403(-)